jgi:plastocyanin
MHHMLLYPLMKGNVYYTGFLSMVLLVFLLATGPVATFATTIAEPTQSPEMMNQTQTTQEESPRVAVGEGSNFTVQYYTFTPQTVEINAGESVTWYSPAEFSELHTVTFVLDQNVMSDIIMPFAVSGGGDTNFERLPPFTTGNPILTQAPDGREAIIALNKDAWYPSVLDANNQISYLNETDIQYTMDGTDKMINSGIIFPEMPPVGAAMNETTTTNNLTTTDTMTTDVTMAPEGEETFPPTEEGLQPPSEEPLFPFPLVSSFTVTFEEPGTYPYFCALHPWMTGEVVVRGGGENQIGTEVGN